MAFTGSLNVIETFAPGATSVAPFAGVVEPTVGAPSAETECTPRSPNVSVANPSHSSAGSKASDTFVSPAVIAGFRRSVLSWVLVRPEPHSVPGSSATSPIESTGRPPFLSTTASSPLNQPAPFV